MAPLSDVTVVAACIIHEGKVLATERGYGNDAGFDETGWWEFPGGKMVKEFANPYERGSAAAIFHVLSQLEPGTLTQDEIETMINDERNGWD